MAKKLRDRGVRADVDERNEKCSSRSVLLKLKRFLTQLIVGDKGNGRPGCKRSSLWPKRNRNHASVDAFVEVILADIANKSRVEK